MDTGFKNDVKLTGDKKTKSPWDFTQPTYDQRSSCFINAGTKHGVGHKVAVGIKGSPKKSYSIPTGRINTLQVMEVPTKSLDDA